MNQEENTIITKEDIYKIRRSNFFIGGKNVSALGLGHDEDEIDAYIRSRGRSNLDLNAFFRGWMDNVGRYPWRFDITFRYQLNVDQRIIALICPDKKARDAMGRHREARYRYGYEFPRLLIDEYLTSDTDRRLKVSLKAAISALNMHCLGEDATKYAFGFLIYTNLVAYEISAATYSVSSTLSSGSLDKCVLSEEKLQKIKSMSEQERFEYELHPSMPASSMDELLNSWIDYGQGIAADVQKGLANGNGIWLYSQLPPFFKTFDEIRKMVEAQGEIFKEPYVSVPYEGARLVKQLCGIIRDLGETPEKAKDILSDTINEALGDTYKELCEFKNRGQFWTVIYEGKTHSFRDTKGMNYIHLLLSLPYASIHVIDLVNIMTRTGPIGMTGPGEAEDTSEEKSGRIRDSHNAGQDPVLDDVAIKTYQRSLSELALKLQEAVKADNCSQAADIREKQAQIKKELASATGLHGRSRKFVDENERARKAVSKCIHESWKTIQAENNALWSHLYNSISLGITCSYHPERRKNWIL